MSNPRNSSLSTTDAVEALTILIEAQAVDITASYADWLRIGFALADEFGFDGESYFHRISAFYPNYSRDESSQQYAKCLQSAGCPPLRGGGRRPGESCKSHVTIATLFYIAAQHGITLSAPCPPLRGGGRRPGESTPNSQLLTPNFSSTSPVEEFEENEENTHPMTFSQDIHENLPLIMQRIIADSHSDEDADILILGSITVFSACIPNVFGVYDRRSVNANLFLYVTAPASAGKGRLSLCRHLAAPIHQSLRDKYKRDMQEYNEKLASYAINRKNSIEVQPKEPPFLSLFVPANSTATVVYQTLSENNGVGLLFETEGDTLANAFKSDMGNYSDGFRKAFHHEPIAYLRRSSTSSLMLKTACSAVSSSTS